jgi:hypothetical protein
MGKIFEVSSGVPRSGVCARARQYREDMRERKVQAHGDSFLFVRFFPLIEDRC